MKHYIKLTFLALLLLCAPLAAGCSAAEARRAVDAAAQRVDDLSAAADQVAGVLDAVAGGLMSNAEAVQAVRGVLPERWAALFDRLLLDESSALDAFAALAASMQTSLGEARAELNASRARLEQVESRAGATLELLGVSVSVADALIGGGALGAVGALIGAVFGRRKGQEEAMQPVAEARAADADFNAIFEDDTRSSTRVMKAAGAATPSLRRSLQRIKERQEAAQ